MSSFPLIPRVRVNYSLRDVIHAFFISERGDKYGRLVQDWLKGFFGVDRVLLTSSGRAGLYHVLNYLPQKKVMMPSYTCMVVVEAALLAHKSIQFVETSRESFNANDYSGVDSDTIVIATHQYGLPCDIERIVTCCHEKGGVVLEDCAAAFGSRVNGKLVGTFGDYAAFSFDPSKLINVPNKAGFVIAKKSEDLEMISRASRVVTGDFAYKMQGLKEGFIYCILKNKYFYRLFHYLTMGRKHAMQLTEHRIPTPELDDYYTHGCSEWQSMFIYNQLRTLPQMALWRQWVFKRYDSLLNNDGFEKPVLDENAVCIRYTIKTKNKRGLYEYCLSRGVDMGFSFNYIGAPRECTEAHEIASEVLNIPYYYNLSDKEVDYVICVLNSLA